MQGRTGLPVGATEGEGTRPCGVSCGMAAPSDRSGSFVVQLTPRGSSTAHAPVRVPVGALVGRHARCALRLDRAGAPLVAAVVVRRGRRLFLEAAGLQPQVEGAPLRRVRLRRGVRLSLGGDQLEVFGVTPPRRVMAVAVGDHPAQELVVPFYALRGGRQPDLLPGEIAHPDAVIVDTGEGWRISVGGRPFDPLVAGRVWQVAGTTLRSRSVDTQIQEVRVVPEPLVLETTRGDDTVRILRATRHRVTLRGRIARLLRTVARQSGAISLDSLGVPHRVHEVLEDLEDALRAHGLRDDLVRPDGVGGLELFLHPADRVVHLAERETG